MKIKYKNYNWGIIFFPIVFFFLIYNVSFKFIEVGTTLLSGVALVFIGMFAIYFEKKINRILILSCVPLILALMGAFLSYVINFPEADIYLFKTLLFIFSIKIFSYSIFDKFFYGKEQFLLKIILSLFLVNSILIVTMFLFSGFQHAYLTTLSEKSFLAFGGMDSAFQEMYRLRMIGASGFASYSVGFAQALGLFILSTLYCFKRKRPDSKYFFMALALIISAILSSRSSIAGIGLWIIFNFLIFGRSYFKIFIGLTCIGPLLIFIISFLIDSDKAIFFINWVLEIFLKRSEAGSLQENIKMFNVEFLDAGLLGFSQWFGLENYNYFREVDIGYIRIILAGGFFVSTMLGIYYFAIGLTFFYGRYKYYFVVMYLFIMVFFSAIMLKGAIIFDFAAFGFILSLFMWLSQKKLTDEYEDINII